MTTRHILVANVFFAPFTYGGATVVAEQVALALLRGPDGGTAYKITAVSLYTRADLQTYAVIKSQRDGITNYVINVPHNRSYADLYDNPQVTKILGELMDDLAPDIVHAHCIQDMGAGVLEAAAARDIPSILSVHDFWWLCDRQFMIRPDQTYCGQFPIKIDACKGCVADFEAAKTRKTYLERIAQLPACVTYPSRFAHDLSVASGFAPARAVIWENGVRLPHADFADKQAARRARDGRLTFGFAGGPSQIKGWPTIRAAFKQLAKSGADLPDFKVIVVDGSPDGHWWRDQSFDDLPGQWEVQPQFAQDGMDDFYARIDVMLFMSQWKETFGLVIREALARGIRIIQTDSGGTVEHGAVPQSDLIAINAPPSVLQGHLDSALARHPDPADPWPVSDYDTQAAAFSDIVQDILKQG